MCQIRSVLSMVLYASHLLAVFMASWLGGGMVKHTEGTIASFPVGLITFHLVLCELSSSTHSSPRFIVIWKEAGGKDGGESRRGGRGRWAEIDGEEGGGGCGKSDLENETGDKEKEMEITRRMRQKRGKLVENQESKRQRWRRQDGRQRPEENSQGDKINETRRENKKTNKQCNIKCQLSWTSWG